MRRATSSAPDPELENQIRHRLHRLAEAAPNAVRMVDEITVHHAAARRDGRRRAAGVGASIAAIAGAVGFGVVALNGAADGGAATPDEAVTRFVAAFENEDVLGMIDVLDPAEVPVLRLLMETAAAEAKRVDVVSDGFALDGIDGLDLEVTDLSLSTQLVADDVAVVSATAGTVTSLFDPAMFPLGGAVRELMSADDLSVITASTELGPDQDVSMLATVQRSERWYVSIGYTIAEYARQATDAEFPVLAPAASEGFATPEEAATALFDRLLAFDLAGAVATAAPGEADALLRYASVWLPGALEESARWRSDGFDLALGEIAYSVSGDGDRRTVEATTFVIEGTVPASAGSNGAPPLDPNKPTVIWSDDGAGFVLVPAGQALPESIAGLPLSNDYPVDQTNSTSADETGRVYQLELPTPSDAAPVALRLERRDGCITWSGPAAVEIFGGGLPGFGFTSIGDEAFQSCASMPVGMSAALFLGSTGFTELPALSTVEVDGRWYVSPIGTIGQAVLGLVQGTPEGGSLFDAPLGVYVYGTNRQLLEQQYLDLEVGGVPAACRKILLDDGVSITGAVAKPSPADIRACAYGYAEEDSASAVEISSAEQVPPTSVAVAPVDTGVPPTQASFPVEPGVPPTTG